MSQSRFRSPVVLYTLDGEATTFTASARATDIAIGCVGLQSSEDPPQHRPPPATTAPDPGFLGTCRSVDEFEKLNRLGEGTYGIVYRARDRRSGQVVALKKIRMNETGSAGLPVSSFREITLLKSIDHPNVVRILDVVVGRRLDSVFMAMEYCTQDMGHLLDNKRRAFTAPEVKCLMHQLLLGTQYIHDRYIVHRDLKLPNLLLTTDGVLKIADFGLARTFEAPHGSANGAGKMTPQVVTLWYRSPELLLGAKRYTSAVDMWSIGCILAELLGHKPIMPGKSEREQLLMIIELLGTPTPRIWPGIVDYPLYRNLVLPQQKYNHLSVKFPDATSDTLDFLNLLFAYDPGQRITARGALKHAYFFERPP
ncbi:Cyclin-dependent kinase 10, partial [Tieghemiomyces parasiticus]